MKDLLVGSTGFVGGNLIASHEFEAVCHSSDLPEYYDSRPEICIYAGVPAAMYLANADPAADLEVMERARENLRKIRPQKPVLISSIAVYPDSRGKNEDDSIEMDGLPAYGRNRLQLERWVREDFPEALIVHLPALYGKGLKKNFLFDLHTITPSMLKPDKYVELSEKSTLVRDGYSIRENSFYCLNGQVEKSALRKFFALNDFNALSFTDSRSRYQFYPLMRLWTDLSAALSNNLTKLNLCTPPVMAGEVYKRITGKNDWQNHLRGKPFDYDLHSRYAELLGGEGCYLCSVDKELDDICSFMQMWEKSDTV